MASAKRSIVRKVFLSSTVRDLGSHREAVYKAISGLDGFQCVRQEDFGARDFEADPFCQQKVKECDVFVGIIGHLYGSSPKGEKTSFTEGEYDAAVAAGIPRLLFLASDDFPLPFSLREPEKRLRLQKRFRERLKVERIVIFFEAPDALATKVVAALRNQEREMLGTEPPSIDSEDNPQQDLAASKKSLIRSSILPYFKLRGWEPKEEGLGCDFLLKKLIGGEPALAGIYVEAGLNLSDKIGAYQVALRAAEALRLRYGPDNQNRLHKFYWITSGEITQSGHIGIRETLKQELATDEIGRVEWWDGEILRGILPLDPPALAEGRADVITPVHRPLSLLDRPIRVEAVAILQRLNLAELWDQIIKSFFLSRGWTIDHEVSENEAIDAIFIFSRVLVSDVWAVRVRLEAAESSIEHDAASLVYRIASSARTALTPSGKIQPPLLRYRWIFPGLLANQVKESIRSPLEEEFGDRVSLWDLDDLYRELVAHEQLQVLFPLKIIYAKHEAARHREDKEGVFAAHWLYRAFRLYLQQEPVETKKALECLDNGLAALEEDPLKELHQHRVFRRVFAAWRKLLHDQPSIFSAAVTKLDDLFDGRIEAALRHEDTLHADWLLLDFECIFRQLEILADKYVDTPAGLSTLQICRLLLRAGFPPTEPGIERRLNRILKDFGKERELGRSIDDSCSLCTGVAVSCFSLARRPNEVDRAVDWLTGDDLRGWRYSTIGSKPTEIKKDEHALHYASSVLQGLLDYEARKEERVPPVLEIFFRSLDEKDSRKFYLAWIRHGNIDRFEICRYILSVFLRYRLMGLALPAKWESSLRQGIYTLVDALKQECEGISELYLYYPVRLNLAALTLGALLGEEGIVVDLMKQVTGYLRRQPEMSRLRAGELWDSSIDRDVVLLESYLDYWETIFFLEESGKPIAKIAELLPDKDPPRKRLKAAITPGQTCPAPAAQT